MKPLTLLLVSALCLTFVGCRYVYGPVEEVKALIEAKDEVILQIGKKIEADPSEAGVDAARKIFEAKKGELQAKLAAMKAAPQGKNSDWMGVWFRSNAHDTEMFDAIRSKLAVDCKSSCLPAQEKLSALEKDFKASAGG